MDHYHSSSGRFFEVTIGLVTSFIALVFCGLFLMLVLNAGLKYVTVIGGSVLLLMAYWFGLISIRLVFHIPNKSGGLFSVGGLKFWCVFLGISALAVSPLAYYMGHWVALVGCIFLGIGCFKGWQIASIRGRA